MLEDGVVDASSFIMNPSAVFLDIGFSSDGKITMTIVAFIIESDFHDNLLSGSLLRGDVHDSGLCLHGRSSYSLFIPAITNTV